MTSPAASSASRLDPYASGAVAVLLAALFVAIALPLLGTLSHDFDEAWMILDARFLRRGLRPFVDFPHHEMPLHLYLLAWTGDLFGTTLAGYRMLSLLSLAGSGLAIFALARPFVGAMPALVAEGLFLLSPVQVRALTAVAETPALLLTLVGAVLLFTRGGRASAWASGVVFVLALFTKPTSGVMALAAAASLVYARDWRRLADFAAAGVLATIVGLAWVVHLSDGIFLDVVRLQLTRVGTHQVGMLAIDSGFADMRRLLGVETPRQWAVLNFQTFFRARLEWTPLALFALGLAALPLWLRGVVRARPAPQAFVVLWPGAYLALNFLVMDFVSPRYFIPYFAFTALLCAGWAWLAARVVGPGITAGAGVLAGVALALHLATILRNDGDPWFWGRTDWIAHEYPRVVSFTPILFAASGTEPGCDLANPVLAYGSFGENFLTPERTRRFRVSDDQLIACLRADPELPIVIDWAFYFFTRPGSRLREYLAGEGSAHRLFFSPDAVEQWDRPLLRMSPLR